MQVGVQPQLYADNLKCVSRDPEVLLGATRFTTGYVRLVGQELAPSKCVLMSTSRAVRSDMRGWVVSDEGHRWSVRRQKTGVSAPNAEGQSFCSFSCSSPLWVI